MIVDLIVGAWLFVLRAFLSLVPPFEFAPGAVPDAVEAVGGSFWWANNYFPVATLAAVIAMVWGYRLVLIVYSGLRELWDAAPLT